MENEEASIERRSIVDEARDEELEGESVESNLFLEWDIEIFISEMEEKAFLWNTEARSHHDSTMRNNAWEDLATKFNKTSKLQKLPSRQVLHPTFN